MSLIEQAAQRLEQLRRAQQDVGTAPAAPVEPAVVAAPVAEKPAAQATQPIAPQPAPAPQPAAPPAPKAAVQPAPSAPEVLQATEMKLSRRVELDPVALAQAGFMRPDSTRSQLADEFRVIKRPLIDNAMGKGAVRIKDGNLIMVTSSLPGEGKTFTAANLAMSIAMELDNTVMLVDADVARPTLLSKLGLQPARGLLDVLVDESIDLPQVLLRTNVEKLTVLPSGTPHAHATELLASDAMVRLLEEMASRYADRIIIFDSPPLLVTTEARALASRMGQVVFVVKAESTSHADVKSALATIEGCPVKLMLLNQTTKSGEDNYGYGYGYQQGYGESD